MTFSALSFLSSFLLLFVSNSQFSSSLQLKNLKGRWAQKQEKKPPPRLFLLLYWHQ